MPTDELYPELLKFLALIEAGEVGIEEDASLPVPIPTAPLTGLRLQTNQDYNARQQQKHADATAALVQEVTDELGEEKNQEEANAKKAA